MESGLETIPRIQICDRRAVTPTKVRADNLALADSMAGGAVPAEELGPDIGHSVIDGAFYAGQGGSGPLRGDVEWLAAGG